MAGLLQAYKQLNKKRMKQLSLAINIILLLAVGYLYYKNFSSTAPSNKNSTAVIPTKDSTQSSTQKIAYIDIDSLSEKIVFFKQSRKALEQQQKSIETAIINDYKTLEGRQSSFYQKNPNPTPEQVQRLNAELGQEQQKIEATKQKKGQELSQRNFELVEKIRVSLKDFLTEYNKTKKYQYILTTGGEMDNIIIKDSTMNITADVIKGLNQKLGQ
jgi:outer membrane protein